MHGWVQRFARRTAEVVKQRQPRRRRQADSERDADKERADSR